MVRDQYDERELSLYARCPARYRYEIIDGLRGSSESSAYVRFHRCVYCTIGWMEEQKRIGITFDQTAAAVQLNAEWEKAGPVGHGFEAYYRASAEAMVRIMAQVVNSEGGTYEREEWSVDLGGKAVVLTPDRVVIGSDGAVHVQRVRTGRKTMSEPDNPIYALLRLVRRAVTPVG